MEYDEKVTKAQMKLAEWANDNQEPDEFATLSVADAHHLSEEQFRARFCTVVREFIVEWGRRWTEEDLPFLKGGRAPDTFTTAEMKEIVLANLYWFDPDGRHPVPSDPPSYSSKGDWI
jgi:hypothetical protein